MQVALLAGTHSGCGKTTIMLALLQYFLQAQKQITAFKAGPDFIDPLWHQAVTGKPSYNLDTRMMGKAACQQQLSRQAVATEIALIEGVMGLFDGAAGIGGEGSSIDLAAVLGCPVLLVVDAGGMSGSIAAVVSGFVQLAARQQVTISGIIANKVGSAYHAELLKNALADCQLPPLLAWLERSPQSIAERHLGLKIPQAGEAVIDLAQFHVEESALLEAFAETKLNISPPALPPQLTGKTVAVAKDAACCFIYPANVDWLLENGATVKYFSPVAGEPIPAAADALWLPGGYPELYAPQLASSATWISLRDFVESGKPVLAECGGAMLLGQAIIDNEGKSWTMAKILPYQSRMQPRLAALGYRQEQSGVRGHEFHYSTRENAADSPAAFTLDKGDGGVRYKNVRASYVHWYFASAGEQVAAWLTHNTA